MSTADPVSAQKNFADSVKKELQQARTWQKDWGPLYCSGGADSSQSQILQMEAELEKLKQVNSYKTQSQVNSCFLLFLEFGQY